MQHPESRDDQELERALTRTPAYDPWRVCDPGSGTPTDERYAALPLTTNAWMRWDAPHRFVPMDSDLHAALASGEAELIRTSGTTGAPVSLVWSQAWWDESERRSWSLNSVAERIASGTHREAVLASARCVGPGQKGHPLSVGERTMGRLLFVNERADVSWSDAEVGRMCEELSTFDPVVFEADPPYLAALAARADELGLELPKPELVVLTYTLASRMHLSRFARSIAAPIASSYGSTETGYVLFSCEYGRLHQNVPSCRIDLAPVRLRRDLARLAVTPFGHPFMCLVRFDVGDIVRLASRPCRCGRADGLQVERIEGRTTDLTQRPDGTEVTLAEVDDALASCPTSEGIIMYQLEQPAPGALRCCLSLSHPVDEQALKNALIDLYGHDAHIAVDRVASPRAEASGKFAAVHTSVIARRICH
jgi:phenylacetate-coenzyme A ligase PaaK-like adenylate-forming protein